MSSMDLCRHFFFIQRSVIQQMLHVTNRQQYQIGVVVATNVSSHQSVKHNRSVWKTGSFQGGSKNWLSIYQLVKSLQLVERQCPSQRVLSFTDVINKLARGRRGSRQATSPPLHLYSIENDFNKKTVLKNNKSAFSVFCPAPARQKMQSRYILQRKQTCYFSSLIGVKPNWRGGDVSVSSQSAVRSRYAWMFEHYQVSTVLLEITVNQRDKGIIDEFKTDNSSSKGSLLILKRLMSLLRVANLKTRGITTSPSLYHNAGRLFT